MLENLRKKGQPVTKELQDMADWLDGLEASANEAEVGWFPASQRQLQCHHHAAVVHLRLPLVKYTSSTAGPPCPHMEHCCLQIDKLAWQLQLYVQLHCR
jgi:hypothetical protein